MPTYLFKCVDCAIEIEEKRPMSRAEEPLECPLCGENCARVITGFYWHGASAPSTKNEAATAAPHPINCPCCYPRQSAPI